MIPSLLAFNTYMADPVLSRDLDILIRCGRLQARAIIGGRDTPTGWFTAAAESYTADDLGRHACHLVAADFSRGVPQ